MKINFTIRHLKKTGTDFSESQNVFAIQHKIRSSREENRKSHKKLTNRRTRTYAIFPGKRSHTHHRIRKSRVYVPRNSAEIVISDVFVAAFVAGRLEPPLASCQWRDVPDRVVKSRRLAMG